MRLRLLAIVLILATIGIGWNLIPQTINSQETYTQNEKTREYLNIMWEGYADFNDLVDSSLIILRGRVDSIVSTSNSSIPSTTYKIHVIEFYKNNLSIEDDYLLASMLGLETSDKIIEVRLNPLMKTGENLILFLNPGYFGDETGKYGFGGPWARFYVVDGKVYSVDVYYSDVYGDGRLVTRVDGEGLQQFVSKIKNDVKN